MYKELSDKVFGDFARFVDKSSLSVDESELSIKSVLLLCNTYEAEIEMQEETLSAVEAVVAELQGSVVRLERLVEARDLIIEDLIEFGGDSDYI